MGLLGPKEGAQGGAQGSPPKGLYKQREGAPRLFTIHGYCSYIVPPLLRAQALGRLRGSSNPDRDASSCTCGYLGGAASAAQGRAAREDLATALPASICSTTSTRDRSSASARLVVIP